MISYEENSVEQIANNFMKKIYPEVNNFIVECTYLKDREEQICTASGVEKRTMGIVTDRKFFLLECNMETCFLKFAR